MATGNKMWLVDQGWTSSGVYDEIQTVFLEEGVIHPYHPAIPGTVEKYKGTMLTLIEEFSVTAKDLEELRK